MMKTIGFVVLATSCILAFQNCTPALVPENAETASTTSQCASDEVTNSFGQCELSGPVSSAAPTLVRSDFMTGLSNPWDLAFTPEGVMLFTERCRGLSARLTNGTTVRLFGTSGSAVVASDLFCEGQSGAHGIAVDPQFASNRLIYFFMASNISTNPRTNRVVRLRLSENSSTVSNRTDIVTDIAYKDQGNAVGGAGSHSGGRLRFGPDGFLYVTTGDNHNGPLPQSPTGLGGKVLRINRNGSAAPNNNSISGADPRIYTLGHRNIQGISFRPLTGQAFTAEHGPGHNDEVTALVAGGNAGWDPRPESGVTCPDGYCGYTTNKLSGVPTPMTDTAKFPGVMPAVWNNGGASQGLGPGEFIRGRKWKAWHGRYAIGVMGANRMDIIELNSSGAMTGSLTAALPNARMRSIVMGPDEVMYVATDAGSIWRVVAQ